MPAKEIFIARVKPPTESPIPGLRWIILGLIFLVTCINYIDRSSIGLLVTRFGPDIHITTKQYGYISSLLLLAYTISQSVSGRLYDRFGARVGFSVSIVVWCIAAMAHSFMTGVVSFAVCSFFLGLGEAGNWPGAAKVIAEWFPQRERAMGMAIFNGGASMGAVIAPLLVAGFLEPHFGWRKTFLIIGSLGFVWLAAWLAIYRPLFQHPRLSVEERAADSRRPARRDGRRCEAGVAARAAFAAADVGDIAGAVLRRSGVVAVHAVAADVSERCARHFR